MGNRKSWIFVAVIFLITNSVFADVYSDIEKYILSNNLEKASSLVTDAKTGKNRPFGVDITSDKFYSYWTIVEDMIANREVQSAYTTFKTSQATQFDLKVMTQSYRDFISIWNEKAKVPFYGSKDLLAIYNKLTDDATARVNEATAAFTTAENMRIRTLQVAREKEAAQLAKAQQERDQKAQEDQAALEKRSKDQEDLRIAQEAESKRQADAELALLAQQKKAQQDGIDLAARKLNLRGLNYVYGIYDFLLSCQSGTATLGDGIDQVFWTQNGAFDSGWRLDEVVGGYEIYRSPFGGSELKIAVKAKNDLQVTGQRLESGVYALKGNKDFKSVLGANLRIPFFVATAIKSD